MNRVSGSVYVHWPYCAKRCSYCNFNKYIPRMADYASTELRMRRCLQSEVKNLLQLSGFNDVRSVFFGGGTPSLMRPDTVQKVLQEISAFCSEDLNISDIEVTLEANPGDLIKEETLVEQFVKAGINRISIGLQSFSDSDLKLLNRDHNSKQGFQALELSLKHLPDSTSVDLIFGRPNQTLRDWKKEMEKILEFPVGHVSLYQLTLERGTQLFKDVQSGSTILPDEETVTEMYENAVDLFESRGLFRYEISNFAREKFQESAHNKWYWRGGEYLGIGPGAHSRFRPRNLNFEGWNKRAVDVIASRSREIENIIDVKACTANRRTTQEVGIGHERSEIGDTASTSNEFYDKEFAENFRKVGKQSRVQTLEPENWMNEVEKVGHGTRKISDLSQKDVLSELVATTLRMREGLTEERWKEVLSELDLPKISIGKMLFSEKVQEFVESGHLVDESQGIRLSKKGLNLADHILSYLLIEINKDM